MIPPGILSPCVTRSVILPFCVALFVVTILGTGFLVLHLLSRALQGQREGLGLESVAKTHKILQMAKAVRRCWMAGM
jgi:hypothetical protein